MERFIVVTFLLDSSETFLLKFLKRTCVPTWYPIQSKNEIFKTKKIG